MNQEKIYKATRFEAKILLSVDFLLKLFPVVNNKRGRENKVKNLKGFVDTFNEYADYFGIDTQEEVSHYLAQIAHESDEWNAYREYASGRAYEGRKDLGNNFKGDGVRFAGRGPIQTTGRANYAKTSRKLSELPFLTKKERDFFFDYGLLKKPHLLENPKYGTLASLIYWVDRDLNDLSQPEGRKVSIKRYSRKRGWYNYTTSPVEAITRKVNGGINGIRERRKFYNAIRKRISR